MDNNKLCNLLGGAGCFAAFMSMGLMFFGVAAGIWGVVAGVAVAAFGLINYD